MPSDHRSVRAFLFPTYSDPTSWRLCSAPVGFLLAFFKRALKSHQVAVHADGSGETHGEHEPFWFRVDWKMDRS